MIEFFILMFNVFIRGSSLLLYLAKENCQAEFLEFLGPFSREEYGDLPGTYDLIIPEIE